MFLVSDSGDELLCFIFLGKDLQNSEIGRDVLIFALSLNIIQHETAEMSIKVIKIFTDWTFTFQGRDFCDCHLLIGSAL